MPADPQEVIREFYRWFEMADLKAAFEPARIEPLFDMEHEQTNQLRLAKDRMASAQTMLSMLVTAVSKHSQVRSLLLDSSYIWG